MKIIGRFYVSIVLIVLLSCISCVTPTTAAAKPTIHALLVIMDGDPVNFKQYQQSERWVRQLLQAVENNEVCKLKLTTLRSHSNNNKEWPNPQRILTWVRELTPDSNDVIFIYYCGHGARNPQAQESGTYFDLTGVKLYRKDLVDTLKAAKAWESRLKILITDTCAVDSSIKIPTEFVGTSAAVDYNERKVYRQLFVEHAGFLHVTSATENEYSWGDSTNGSWFTNSLVRSINSHPDSIRRFVGWNEVFADAKEEVKEFLEQHRQIVGTRIQHPRFYGDFPKRIIRSHLNPNDAPNGLSAKAHVQKVWVDHNQYQNSIKGMRIHVRFDVDNFKGYQGSVVAYFYDKNGEPLKDTNQNYNTTGGNVSVGDSFRPPYDNSIYKDYPLFMPYRELHLSGKHNLKFRIQVHTGNASSKLSDWFSFTYTGPEAHVQKVWVDHNQYQNSIKGMRIHVRFDVDNFKGYQGSVVAYFYDKNGEPLKDTNQNYNTTGGNVSVGDSFRPPYDNSIYKDYPLFMPYRELHLSGKHNLKFRIQVHTGNASSKLSDWVYFDYSSN